MFLIILLYLEKLWSTTDWKFKKMGPLCFSHGLEEQMGQPLRLTLVIYENNNKSCSYDLTALSDFKSSFTYNSFKSTANAMKAEQEVHVTDQATETQRKSE